MFKSKYACTEHPTIIIDGVPFDLYLHNLYPDNLFLGLVPTITDWIHMKEEAIFVLSRFHSEQETVILPILMCPDDCDLICTVIVAEVIINNNQIIWKRVGTDISNLGLTSQYELIGTEVNWLNSVPEMIFDKNTYLENLKLIYKPIE
ncbi:hypothetical protein [Paenibacillus taichungensis]|uniref:hypothetical protein n=1 Tax=Paenibacillus taichungensis TaxID=484184 RepID=UPI001C2FA6B9|nr:hypothetical protein [Paenibacillus taichungensis]